MSSCPRWDGLDFRAEDTTSQWTSDSRLSESLRRRGGNQRSAMLACYHGYVFNISTECPGCCVGRTYLAFLQFLTAGSSLCRPPMDVLYFFRFSTSSTFSDICSM